MTALDPGRWVPPPGDLGSHEYRLTTNCDATRRHTTTMKVDAYIDYGEEINDYGGTTRTVSATCSECGAVGEAYGDDDDSKKAALAKLRERCKNGDQNWFEPKPRPYQPTNGCSACDYPEVPESPHDETSACRHCGEIHQRCKQCGLLAVSKTADAVRCAECGQLHRYGVMATRTSPTTDGGTTADPVENDDESGEEDHSGLNDFL